MTKGGDEKGAAPGKPPFLPPGVAWWAHWFFYPPEGSLRTLPRRVKILNFSAALLIIGLAVYLPFTQLTAPWNWGVVYKYREKFLQGFWLTIVISVGSLILSTALGICSALAGRSRFLPLRYANKIYIDLVRGTPLLVQILILYYVTANAIGIDDRNVAGILILSIFSAAYISEVIRGGIESVGKSQLESAKAIGLTRSQTYVHVIFPQAIRQIMPSMAGQFVSLIKDSSLLSIISVSEFTKNAEETSNITFSSLECYIPLAVGYLLLTLPISILTRHLESRHRFET
jgi:polar amino acid transport system permease protein